MQILLYFFSRGMIRVIASDVEFLLPCEATRCRYMRCLFQTAARSKHTHLRQTFVICFNVYFICNFKNRLTKRVVEPHVLVSNIGPIQH